MSTRRIIVGVVIVVMVCGISVYAFAEKAATSAGEKLFMANCSVCHPDGSNIVNPKKTLHKKDRDANNVKTADDIMHRMRHPGPGMTQFDENAISNKDAHEIAEYIMKTFK